MRVLVTGAGGFIGGHLYRSLSRNLFPGDYVVGINNRSEHTYDNHPANDNKTDCGNILIECHLNSDQWTSRLMHGFKPDIVYHFAGCSTVSSKAFKVWNSNVDTTFNLLNNLPESKKVRFVLASSVLAEECNSVYGASKAAAENLVRAYTKLGKIDGICLRFCAVAGPYNTHGVVRDVVRKFVNDDVVRVFGKEPGANKPFTHVDDIVCLTKYFAADTYYDRFSPLIISPGYDNLSVKQICDIVKEETGFDKKVEWSGESWPGDQQTIWLPNHTMKSLLKGSQKQLLTSEEAVRKAVKEILELEYGIIPKG